LYLHLQNIGLNPAGELNVSVFLFEKQTKKVVTLLENKFVNLISPGEGIECFDAEDKLDGNA
jgi:hypothetical protein